ncbi:probable RNA methyltransferase At5g51130 [Cornus florida]|uniref:probable RNA methyltransferase At5g51130 n=1 Tax=Cornus florida TaxID=4283 RepID=UPI0028A1A08C|nr:probable RNA methyltransferase At5g51130 [Cornus florida]
MYDDGDNNKNNNGEHESTSQRSVQKRKRKEVAIFGNYRNYYGYRVGQDLKEDPRLKVFRKEFFEGKDCLDIGCNNGSITIAIAEKFFCQSILGIDIDGDRIEDARWNLRKTVMMTTRKMPPKISKLKDEKGANGLKQSVTKPLTEATRETSGDCSPLQGRDLFDIISFEKGNFVRSWRSPENKCYDTILCLSVTKWIHLNWGDDGLITLFANIWRLLQQGGILILEPQPWNSYSKNRRVSETAASNYQNIKIFPEDFQEILMDKIGFRKVEDITSSLSGSNTGFDRPILAFWK